MYPMARSEVQGIYNHFFGAEQIHSKQPGVRMTGDELFLLEAGGDELWAPQDRRLLCPLPLALLSSPMEVQGLCNL